MRLKKVYVCVSIGYADDGDGDEDEAPVKD
jgi:hypothetical protein